jgi:hypothetical protein
MRPTASRVPSPPSTTTSEGFDRGQIGPVADFDCPNHAAGQALSRPRPGRHVGCAFAIEHRLEVMRTQPLDQFGKQADSTPRGEAWRRWRRGSFGLSVLQLAGNVFIGLQAEHAAGIPVAFHSRDGRIDDFDGMRRLPREAGGDAFDSQLMGAGSRTMPPLPTCSRPASNCGLTSTTASVSELAAAEPRGRTSVAEMNETSMTSSVSSALRVFGLEELRLERTGCQQARVGALIEANAGVLAQAHGDLAESCIHAGDVARAMLQAGSR